MYTKKRIYLGTEPCISGNTTIRFSKSAQQMVKLALNFNCTMYIAKGQVEVVVTIVETTRDSARHFMYLYCL